jgi:UDP-N-acetylmuramyl tripeptide synthase
VSNILVAATAAFGPGISDTTIKAGIEALKAVPGRIERIDEG